MSSTLLQEKPKVPEASLSIAVTVTVAIASKENVSFESYVEPDFKVEPQSVLLVGSGGAPREFQVNFRLSTESIQLGYTFANPALKFFQGDSKNAGFRVNRTDQFSATVFLFNTKKAEDKRSCDEFSLLFYDPEGVIFSHDPTIIWDPPGGGAA